MARYVVKKKRKSLKWGSVAKAFITFSFIFFLATTLFVRNYNLNLTKVVQNTQSETVNVNLQNDTLEKDIAILQDRERIVSIAKNAGLDTYNNIKTIKSGE